MILNTLERYALAIEFLSLQARITIASEQTGLSHKVLSKAFVEMHKRSPSRGSQKYNTNFIFKNSLRRKEATLFVFFFRIEAHDDFSRRAINAYQRYSSYINSLSNSKPQFDFSDAWQIAKWSQSGLLKLVRCEYCRSAKLINDQFEQHPCPICKKP